MCGGHSSILHYGPLKETNYLYASTPNGQSPSAWLNKSNNRTPLPNMCQLWVTTEPVWTWSSINHHGESLQLKVELSYGLEYKICFRTMSKIKTRLAFIVQQIWWFMVYRNLTLKHVTLELQYSLYIYHFKLISTNIRCSYSIYL